MRMRNKAIALLLLILGACSPAERASSPTILPTAPLLAKACANVGVYPSADVLVAPVPVGNWESLVARGFGDAVSGQTAAASPVTTSQDDLHLGIDIGVGPGTPVQSVGPGWISRVGTAQGYGHVVEVEHVTSKGDVFSSLYGHLDGNGLVTCGQVNAGDVLGYVGAKAVPINGGVNPHLHFGIQRRHNTTSIRGHLPRSQWPEDWCAPASFIRSPGTCHQGILRVAGALVPGIRSRTFDLWFHDEDLASALRIQEAVDPNIDEREPATTDDGRLTVFVSNKNGTDDIFVLDRGPNDRNVLARLSISSSTQRDHQPTISGDGRYIAFVTTTSAARDDLVLFDRKLNQAITLPPGVNTPFDDGWPSLSADGRLLAYYAANSFEGLRILDLSSGKFLPLPPSLTRGVTPFFSLSGDGRSLAVMPIDPTNQRFDIHVYDLSDPTYQRVDRLTILNGTYPTKGEFAISHDASVIAAHVFPMQRVALYDRSTGRLRLTSAPVLSYGNRRIALTCWPLVGPKCMQ